MSIRARILVPLALLTLTAFAIIGTSAVTFTRNGMIDRLDASLRVTQAGLSAESGRLTVGGRAISDVARVSFEPSGRIEEVRASGSELEADPLPAIDELLAVRPPAPGRAFATVSSGDGSALRYRAMVVTEASGRSVAYATPLDDVEAVTRRLSGVLTTATAIVLFVLLVLAWTLVRLSLRPIEGMIDAASAIAGGDYSRRIDYVERETEVGRLGSALNTMLARIERAFDAERSSQEQLRRFVADASHELRTPLTSIQGYAQLYRSGAVEEPDGVDRTMARIESAGERMASLVEELLLLTRLDHGVVPEFVEVDLAGVVAELIADRRVLEPARPLVQMGDEVVVVLGDRLQLRRVVDNLLSNACEHTQPGVLVVLSVTMSHGVVELRVSDNGDGLAEADAARVFDRFFRAENSRSRRSGGTGLGLAITRAIVTAHNGSIVLETEPGAGCTVRVLFPDRNVRGFVHEATRSRDPRG